jgi:hypothetical protein
VRWPRILANNCIFNGCQPESRRNPILIISILLASLIGSVVVILWVRRIVKFQKVDALILFVAMHCLWLWPSCFYFLPDGKFGYLLPLYISSTFFFYMGFVVFSGSGASLHDYRRRPFETGAKKGFFASILLLNIFAGSFFYGGLPPIISGFVELFRFGGGDDLANQVSEQRLMFTKDHWLGGEYRGQGVFSELLRVGWFFAIIFSLSAYSLRQSKWWLGAFLASFITGSIYIGGSGERSHLLSLLFLLLVSVSFLEGLKWRTFVDTKLLMIAVVTVFVMVIITTTSSRGLDYVNGEKEMSEMGLQIFQRLVFGNGVHDVQLGGFVASGEVDVRYGMYHVEKFLSSFPGVRYGVPLGFVVSGLIGSAAYVNSSGTYLSYIIADFGNIWVPIAFFLLGFLVAVLQKVVLTLAKTPEKFTFSMIAIYTLGQSYSIGPIGIASIGVVLCVVYLLGWVGSKIFSR